MDFRKIEYFIEVAECLNFRKAADRIHISHQGLSKQIRILEEELGAALLERNTVKVALTDVGKRLYEAFRPIVAEADRSYEKIREYIALRKSMLVIGYFNALSFQRVISPVLDYIRIKQPGLDIDVYATEVGDARMRFMRDELDLLITVMMDEDEWKTVSYYSLQTCPLKIIVSARHPWYRQSMVSEQDLKNASMLFYKTGSASFMKNLPVKSRVSMYNYDSYMSRLSEGAEFGVVADIYSKREGEYKLFDLPEKYMSSTQIIAAFKREHPLNGLLNKLKNFHLQ